jgi:benzodiazapine receptor
MNRLTSPAQIRASILRWALFLVPTVMLLGFLSGQVGGDASSQWFQSLEGLAFALVCAAWGARFRTVAIVAFLVQLALNLAWSPTFFGAHQITLAQYLLVAIDVAVLVTMVLFFRVRRLAGWLLVPYLGWVLFATVLNWQFLQLNPEADGRDISGSIARIEL